MRAELDADVVAFSSLAQPAVLPPATAWVELPRDDAISPEGLDPRSAEPTAKGLLHWAPLGHDGHAARLGLLAAKLATGTLDALVVDVSVEVTLLSRLFGVRPVIFAQPGERHDEPHRLGYLAADRIIAPWPAVLYRPESLEPHSAKVSFVGGISRFDGRVGKRGGDVTNGGGGGDDRGTVVVLGSAGGSSVLHRQIEQAAAATPEWRWTALGLSPALTDAHPESTPAARPARSARSVSGRASSSLTTPRLVAASSGDEVRGTLSIAPWTNDPFPAIRYADVVVSWAGQNAVADLAVAGSRAIVLPQSRPFDEQAATAAVLARSGLAAVAATWPAAADWPALLRSAALLDPDWSAWQTAGAARRAADAIDAVARTAHAARTGHVVPTATAASATRSIPPAPATSTAPATPAATATTTPATVSPVPPQPTSPRPESR